MKVNDVAAIPVEVDVKPRTEEMGLAPYVSNHDAVESVDRMLIRVETTDGIIGWGEMLVTMTSPSATKVVIDDVIAPELIGERVTDISGFIDDFYFPYVKVDPFLGGITTALWDALGKHLGAPLYQLLGGASRRSIPLSYCVGILDPEKSREHARRAVDAGFTTLKTKAGHDWRRDVDRIAAMHDETDGQLDFRLDPNQGWTFEDAVRAISMLEDQGIYLQYIEQPLRTDTYGAYRQLRSRLRTPIGVNEDTYFRGNLNHLLSADAIDVAVIDHVPAGGLTAAQELAALAGKAGVSVSHHCGFDLGIKTAAVAHLMGATPAINLAPDSVYYAWEDYVLEDPLRIADGELSVPEDPGLGISVDEKKVEQLRID